MSRALQGRFARPQQLRQPQARSPSRGRSSKVQQNVIKLFVDGRESVIPTEIDALADKTAATLATTFELILRALALSIFPAAIDRQPQAPRFDAGEQPQSPTPIWFTHVLVGDGIATNEAAAKLLLAMLRARALCSYVISTSTSIGRCVLKIRLRSSSGDGRGIR